MVVTSLEVFSLFGVHFFENDHFLAKGEFYNMSNTLTNVAVGSSGFVMFDLFACVIFYVMKNRNVFVG